jgi:hypothetical protein
MISTTLFGVDSACSPERAVRPAVMNPVMAAAFSEYVPSLWGGTHQGAVITGALPAQVQGTTVSGASLQGAGLGVPAFIAGDATPRVRKGVPAGTTTSSSPPV